MTTYYITGNHYYCTPCIIIVLEHTLSDPRYLGDGLMQQEQYVDHCYISDLPRGGGSDHLTGLPICYQLYHKKK